MDSWKRFDETSLPDKEDFYSSLNIKDIIDVDYRCAKRVYKEFNNITFRWLSWFICLDWYIIICWCIWEFKKKKKWIEIYELDPAHCLSAPRLAWQATLRKTEIELELLTENDVLLMKKK